MTEPANQPEEQIDIGGGPNPTLAKQIREQAAITTAAAPSIEDQLKPGMSNEDLLEAVISAPVESLIPWETCQLPSKGLYYNGWDSGAIGIRAMNQVAEKILATQRLAQTGESIDYLFNECTQLQAGTDPADLLLGDRVFLLYYLRGITFGNIYEFAVTCPNPDCNGTSTHAYDINGLAGTIVWAKEELGPEPFKIVLPHMSRQVGRPFWIHVRFLRARDGQNMLAVRRQKRKFVQPATIRAGRPQQFKQQEKKPITFNETITENLEMCIVSAMGSTDRFKIQALVPKLHSEDTSFIREWLRDNSPGIETMITLKCAECGIDYVSELPITESFFRPTQQRGIGKAV